MVARITTSLNVVEDRYDFRVCHWKAYRTIEATAQATQSRVKADDFTNAAVTPNRNSGKYRSINRFRAISGTIRLRIRPAAPKTMSMTQNLSRMRLYAIA